ncbi:MAG: hypothetical protein CL928_17650 [Deltaproteobacteria bacterium]|nr:hypothetical protein [Deltaproteobacteria bacterium]
MSQTPPTRSLAESAVATAVALGLALVGGQSSIPIGPTSALVALAMVSLAIQWLAFVPAYRLRTERYFDAMGSVGFLAVLTLGLVFAASNDLLETRRIVVATMVGLWTLRLGSFLFRRIHKAGSDPRFDHIKQDPFRFFMVWSLQGLWVSLTAMAALIVLVDSQPGPALGMWDALGIALWVLGFVVEVIADHQKTVFRREPENQGRWIDKGLWAYSQHPNYFGEILLWTGVFVTGAAVYDGLQWCAVLSPLFVAVLLTRISGIPPLDERALELWGDDPAYLTYRQTTNVLVPGPRSLSTDGAHDSKPSD